MLLVPVNIWISKLYTSTTNRRNDKVKFNYALHTYTAYGTLQRQTHQLKWFAIDDLSDKTIHHRFGILKQNVTHLIWFDENLLSDFVFECVCIMASTLQLEFAQAMSDFKTMFPDMERDVIEAVLRANQGAVDATIDQLLAMSVDNQASIREHIETHRQCWRFFLLIFQNEKLRNELDDSGHSLIPHVSVDTPDLIEPIRSMTAAVTTGASPKVKLSSQMPDLHNPATVACDLSAASKGNRKWNPPMLGPLPPTFLRLAIHDVTYLICPFNSKPKKKLIFFHVNFINRIAPISTFPTNNSLWCCRMKNSWMNCDGIRNLCWP